MVASKKHDHDKLIKYLLSVLEMLKDPMLEKKNVNKLFSLFGKELKVFAVPEILLAPIAAPQMIDGSLILKLQS